jgi:hypothetical protein
MSYIISRKFENFLSKIIKFWLRMKKNLLQCQYNLSFEMESSNLINYPTDMCWSYSWTTVSLYIGNMKRGPFWTPKESGDPTKRQLKPWHLGHQPTSISSPVCMWRCKTYFSHPSFSFLRFFPTPPIKLKLGLQIHGRLIIANHLD